MGSQAACRRGAAAARGEGREAAGGRRHPFLLGLEDVLVGLAHRLDRVAAEVVGRVFVDVGLGRVRVRARARARARVRVS